MSATKNINLSAYLALFAGFYVKKFKDLRNKAISCFLD